MGDEAFNEFAEVTGKTDRAVGGHFGGIFAVLWDRANGCPSPTLGNLASRPAFVVQIEYLVSCFGSESMNKFSMDMVRAGCLVGQQVLDGVFKFVVFKLSGPFGLCVVLY